MCVDIKCGYGFASSSEHLHTWGEDGICYQSVWLRSSSHATNFRMCDRAHCFWNLCVWGLQILMCCYTIVCRNWLIMIMERRVFHCQNVELSFCTKFYVQTTCFVYGVTSAHKAYVFGTYASNKWNEWNVFLKKIILTTLGRPSSEQLFLQQSWLSSVVLSSGWQSLRMLKLASVCVCPSWRWSGRLIDSGHC